jgi:hypothetical protein
MPDVSSLEKPPPGREAATLAAAAALTFEPMGGAVGPTHEHWLQYLIYIRGALAALRFDDGDLTERMRHGFDSDADALESVHAWAETERQLVAAVEILRTAQTRCTLAASRVGTRNGRQAGAAATKALNPET